MPDHQTPQQMIEQRLAESLRIEAAHIESTARILRTLANELDPPGLPEVSRASHYS